MAIPLKKAKYLSHWQTTILPFTKARNGSSECDNVRNAKQYLRSESFDRKNRARR
ncbi:MAG: hypothetical protein KME05_22350 [Gloeocapsa sp. UFS-A4-WI-NPMV-4B04]|nr:hypothetical protein [Gloeocapsa sp. UFS-A4-WI-NPMV-4B04]